MATEIVPLVRTDDLHARFCEEIASGKSMRQTCADNGWGVSFFHAWHREDTAVANRYARACKERADVLMEDMITLADSAREPTVMGMDGEEVPTMGIDPARVQAIKLAVETRKWAASKLHPTKYGDVPAQVNVGVGVQVAVMTQQAQDELIAKKREAVERRLALSRQPKAS